MVNVALVLPAEAVKIGQTETLCFFCFATMRKMVSSSGFSSNTGAKVLSEGALMLLMLCLFPAYGGELEL